MTLIFFSFLILFLIETPSVSLAFKNHAYRWCCFSSCLFYDSLACHVYGINKRADGKKRMKGRRKEKKKSGCANKSSLENDKFINAFCKITYRARETIYIYSSYVRPLYIHIAFYPYTRSRASCT